MFNLCVVWTNVRQKNTKQALPPYTIVQLLYFNVNESTILISWLKWLTNNRLQLTWQILAYCSKSLVKLSNCCPLLTQQLSYHFISKIYHKAKRQLIPMIYIVNGLSLEVVALKIDNFHAYFLFSKMMKQIIVQFWIYFHWWLNKLAL